jgi:hypothetical protein
MGRLALELIAQAGLGHTFHSLEGENDEYSNALKSIVYVPFLKFLLFFTILIGFCRPVSANLQMFRPLTHYATTYIPAKLLRWVAERMPSQSLRKMINMSDIIYGTAERLWKEKLVMFEHGDEHVTNQLGEGRDLMSILCRCSRLCRLIS